VPHARPLVVATTLSLGVTLCASALHAGTLATGWNEGHSFKTRMIIGARIRQGGARQLVAGLEIVLEPGWKTYWRSPGDAGGIPPNFDWSKSRNLKSVRVLYPAPHRFTDTIGTTIGYKHHVVLPAVIEPRDPTKPVGIALDTEFGVCREICIPARAQLAVEVSPGKIAALPPQLANALDDVPLPLAADKTGKRPHLVATTLRNGPSPALIFDVAYPDGVSGADLFAESLGSLYLPVVKPLGKPVGGTARFALDLSGDVTPNQIRGQRLRLTIVSDAASSEMELTVK
jgi:DsbC/DsbD-like thiol-disulfide interchange protein